MRCYSLKLMEDSKVHIDEWQIWYCCQHDLNICGCLFEFFCLIVITTDSYTNPACEQEGTGTSITHFYLHR